MAKRTKIQIGAAAVAGFAVAVALGAVGGFAAAEALSDDEPESVAVRADVEPDDEERDESESLTEALDFLVDEAVEAGRLSEEEGEELKERLRAGDLPSFLPRPGKAFRIDPGLFAPGRFGLFFFGDVVDLETAAEYIGLSETALRDELEDGRSLADLARERDKSVDGLVEELAEDAEQRIDEAVDDGRLSEERAARLKDDLEERVRDRVESSHRFPKFERLPDFGFGGPGG